MGMREQLQRRARLGGVLRGIVLAAVLVGVNAFAAFNWIPSSYQQFTWQAYAEVVYTDTPTSTPTATATPTNTPVANGGSCAIPSQCQSGFCVEGTCCDAICNQPGQTCASGTCVSTAPAPAMSKRSLLLVVVLLTAIGCFALTPLRFGKRR